MGNFDALLLGGFYCHTCLPMDNGAMCESGGVCQNIQWLGYTCDNHFYVDSMSLSVSTSSSTLVKKKKLIIDSDVKYRFTITGEKKLCLTLDKKGQKKISIPGHENVCAEKGPLIFIPSDISPKPKKVYLYSSHLKKSFKLKLKLPCEDGELSYEGNTNKKFERTTCIYIIISSASMQFSCLAWRLKCFNKYYFLIKSCVFCMKVKIWKRTGERKIMIV